MIFVMIAFFVKHLSKTEEKAAQFFFYISHIKKY